MKLGVIGLDPACELALESVVPRSEWIAVPASIQEILSLKVEVAPTVLLVGPTVSAIEAAEFAQALRSRFPDAGIYSVTCSRKDFNRASRLQMGFNDAFLFPADQQIFREAVSAEKTYRDVKLIDLRPGQVLDFDTYVYMPANRKRLRFTAGGDEIDEERFRRAEKNFSNIQVSSDQMKHFYAFAAKQLRKLQGGAGMSATERRERMTQAVRTLISGIFADSTHEGNIAHGRAMVEDCQGIVKNFIEGDEGGDGWYSRILAVTGASQGAYNHAGNVATFAALFSLASGVGKPEDAALAGLLHDIGLADVPAEIQLKPEAERTPEEEEIYRSHVDASLELIRVKKLILNESVQKAIAQHHERWSGTGYPLGRSGKTIVPEARVLALADTFDDLTAAQDGSACLSPAAAFRKIYEDDLKDPTRAQFDLDLLNRLVAVFPNSVPNADAA